MREVPGHPIAPPSGFVAVSRLVLYNKVGPGTHSCHWCDRPVSWQAGGGPATVGNLLADHLNWDRQDDRPENLVPSCNSCNAHRAAPDKRQTIDPTEPTVQVGRYRTRAEKRECPTCGVEFLTLPSRPRTFCSRSCANEARATTKGR